MNELYGRGYMGTKLNVPWRNNLPLDVDDFG